MAAPCNPVAAKHPRGGSDEEADSDAEQQHEIWIPAVVSKKGVSKTQKCKGCNKQFPFEVAPGAVIRDSATVKAFYKHCLEQCVPYSELGVAQTCDDCQSLFLNAEQKTAHFDNCLTVSSEKHKAKRGSQSVPPVASAARRTSTSSNSSDQESNSPDGNADDDAVDPRISQSVNNNMEKLIEKRMQEIARNPPATPAVDRKPGPRSRTMTQAATPAASAASATPRPSATATGPLTPVTNGLTGRPRPGPKSRTKPDGYDADAAKPGGPLQRAPVIPKPEAVHQVETGRRLSGKNMNQLMAARNGRQRATPSQPATKRKASKSSSKKKRARLSSEHESSEDEYPETIRNLPPVILKPEEYLFNVPSKSKNMRFFNMQTCCPACKKQFAACMDPDGKSVSPIPSPLYYKHCLSVCQPYIESFAKSCSSCFHRYLTEEDFRSHRRGICAKLTKKMSMLKLRMPWMRQQLFLDLLDLKINDEMCCPGCRKTYDCCRRGNEYIPGLQLQCHLLDECEPFITSGKRIECRNCAKKDGDVYYYISTEDYEKYDSCHEQPEASDDEDDVDPNDPNSPYYGKGRGKGKVGLS